MYWQNIYLAYFILMNRSACPPSLCVCWYGKLQYQERIGLWVISELSPNRVREWKNHQIIALLQSNWVRVDTDNNFVGTDNNHVPYLCLRTQQAIVDKLWVEIEKLRQYSLNLLPASDPDDEPVWIPWEKGSLLWNNPDFIDLSRAWSGSPREEHMDA
jgi:hypothetical protein